MVKENIMHAMQVQLSFNSSTEKEKRLNNVEVEITFNPSFVWGNGWDVAVDQEVQ